MQEFIFSAGVVCLCSVGAVLAGLPWLAETKSEQQQPDIAAQCWPYSLGTPALFLRLLSTSPRPCHVCRLTQVIQYLLVRHSWRIVILAVLFFGLLTCLWTLFSHYPSSDCFYWPRSSLQRWRLQSFPWSPIQCLAYFVVYGGFIG